LGQTEGERGVQRWGCGNRGARNGCDLGASLSCDQSTSCQIPFLESFFKVAIEGTHRHMAEVNGGCPISADIANSGEQLRKLG
jgi:hypothetical protein